MRNNSVAHCQVKRYSISYIYWKVLKLHIYYLGFPNNLEKDWFDLLSNAGCVQYVVNQLWISTDIGWYDR